MSIEWKWINNFSGKNIYNEIVKQCLETGRPEEFFEALAHVVGVIEEQVDDNENFWEENRLAMGQRTGKQNDALEKCRNGLDGD